MIVCITGNIQVIITICDIIEFYYIELFMYSYSNLDLLNDDTVSVYDY